MTESTRHFSEGIRSFFNFQSLPSSHGNCRSICRHRTKFFEVHYTPFTLTVFTRFGLIMVKNVQGTPKLNAVYGIAEQIVQALIRCCALRATSVQGLQ